MRPSEKVPGSWLLGRTLDWQLTAAEVALAAPILAWRTGLALAGGWVAPGAAARPAPEPHDRPVPGPLQPAEAAADAPEPAEEVDHLA